MTDSGNDEPQKTVHVYNQPYNRLKNKLGARIHKNEEVGHLEEEKVDKADALIKELCADCQTTIAAQLAALSAVWGEMQKMDSSNARDEKAQEVFTIAHEIKDISSLCGYVLAAHFAESLRDYIGETTLNLKNQHIIIQAHIDAMNTVHKNNIKEDGGPVAEELKRMVKIAIDKYH